MPSIDRQDNSVIGGWWLTVDRWNFAAFCVLASLGFALSFLASPAVARRINIADSSFYTKQGFFVVVALLFLFLTSLANKQQVRRMGVIMLVGALVLMVATLFFGMETKGASRWIRLFGFSVQPSEFLKPAFAIFTGWMFSAKAGGAPIPTWHIVGLVFASALGLLLLQPDLGQSMVLSMILGAQIFLLGIPLSVIMLLALLAIGGLIGAYFTFDHVKARIDGFLAAETGDRSQIDFSMEAFTSGGWFGRGPGEGIAKLNLPDAHTDFILAVIGEEMGLIAVLSLILFFGAIIVRAGILLIRQRDLFSLYAGAGLIAQFATQILINMASSLALIPPKGMALPFLSYGGSSLVSSAIAMGFLLALTRKHRGVY